MDFSEAPGLRPERTEFWPLAAAAALAVPMLLAHNVPPSATFFNQAAAFIGWGGFLALASATLVPPRLAPRGAIGLLLAALALLVAAALASPLWTGLPWALALSSAGTIAAAAWVAWVASALARQGLADAAFRALCIGVLVAGLASAAVGFVQADAPGLADGFWIAQGTIPGRAAGNLRQPNHLSSLLLWAIIAVVWLGQARALPRAAALALAALMLYAVVLTASRTGMAGAALLCLWGLADRRLARPLRVALVLTPLAYALFFQAAALLAQQTEQAFGGVGRLSGGNLLASRAEVWRNAVALIAMHPWAGVGFGEFNFAWTLTPFPGRLIEFFDHTHNLPLQLWVELGLPLGSAVLGLLLAALAGAARQASAAQGHEATVVRAALVMVLMIAMHSLAEYPLWYAYFLFPTAFAFGLCLARPASPAQEPEVAPRAALPVVLLSLAVLAGGVFALRDYMTVVRIFAAPEDGSSLEQRIARGRRSWFFSHHADYAAATTPEHPSEAMAAFDGAPHYLLDARLMMAWARALDEAGDTDRARYLAARLAEFRNEQAVEFFAPCADEKTVPAALPFQCLLPQHAGLGYGDFRRPR